MGLDLLGAVLITAPLALLAWRLRAVTRGGALTGFLCAVAVYLGAYLAGIAVLGVALLLTALTSRVGWRRKVARGIAEDRDGRDAAGVLANCAVGALAGILAASSTEWAGETGAILLVTGLAAGASDTVASEVGKAFGGRPRAFPSFQAVAPGAPGGVTVVGMLAGLGGAAATAWPAVILWLLPAERVPVVVVACALGAFIESTLASRLETKGVLGTHALSLLNTASAAAIALWWVSR